MDKNYKYASSVKREDTIFMIKIIIGFFAFICFVYTVRQLNIFVVIGLDFLLKVHTICGLFFTLILYKIDKKLEKDDYNFISQFVRKFFTYGSIFSALFLLSNDYLSNNKEYYITELILEKKEGNHRSSNTITVKIEDSETEINVNKYSYDKIKKSNYAKIKLKNGYWNKLLILDTKLIE